jgi:predicted metal-dependent peptidase
MMFETLTTEEKFKRIKIQLGYDKPFWAYLSLHLNIRERNPETEKIIDTLCVDSKGNLIYNPDFINSLTENELKGVVAHEVFHVAFEHLKRIDNKTNHKAWNISADLVVNDVLRKDNFSLPKCGIQTKYDSSFKLENDYEIENIDKKSVEQIYNEIKDLIKEEDKENGFDNHKLDSEKEDDSKQNGGGKDNNNSKDWKKIVTEAYYYGEQRGHNSQSLKRMLGDLLNPKVNWKQKLYKYITNQIPNDYSWSKPSKKSISCGIYLPSQVKENLEVVVGIDVSGSVNQKDYDEFIAEVVSIAQSFDNIKMNVLTWDTRVKNEFEVYNGNVKKILEHKIIGGGGTNINCLFEKIEKDYPRTKVLVVITDGDFGRIDKEFDCNILWLLTNNGTENYIDNGEIIRLE